MTSGTLPKPQGMGKTFIFCGFCVFLRLFLPKNYRKFVFTNHRIKSAVLHQEIQQSARFTDPDLLLHANVDDFLEEVLSEKEEEQKFDFLKYVILTAVIVLLIAFTVFISNRNQVSQEKEIESSEMISFFKK